MNKALRLLSILVFLGTVPAAGAEDTLILRNVTIVDPEKGERQGSVLIRDGKIVSVTNDPPRDIQGTVLDLDGRWLIPGLADMHTHSYGNPAPSGPAEFMGSPGTAKRMLYSGVTAFLDLFNQETAIFDLRDSQRKSGLVGADIFAAGPCLTATGGHCSEYGIPTRIINTAEEARRQVGELAAKSPDVVKIVYDHGPGRMPSIDFETLRAALDTARQNGIKTVIHIGTWQDVRDSARAGASAVTHVPDNPMPEDIPKLLAEKGVAIIPTLVVQTELSNIAATPGYFENPLLDAVTADALVRGYRDESKYSQRITRWRDRQKEKRDQYFKAVKRLSEAGVTVMTGTDAGNLGVFQGFSVHREMQLLVEAGLSTRQALAAATVNPSRFLGRPWGVRAGETANLVVLSGSPLQDIGNTQKIEYVIQRGKVVDRSSLLPWKVQ